MWFFQFQQRLEFSVLLPPWGLLLILMRRSRVLRRAINLTDCHMKAPKRSVTCYVGEVTRRRKMDYWWIIAVIVVWIVLQAYLLPKLGIST
jgi:hypothetical protein